MKRYIAQIILALLQNPTALATLDEIAHELIKLLKTLF